MNKANKKTKKIKKNSLNPEKQFYKLSKKLPDGTRYWFARDLQKTVFDYKRWDHFESLIYKTIQLSYYKIFTEKLPDIRKQLRDKFVIKTTKEITKKNNAKEEIDDYIFDFMFCYKLSTRINPKKKNVKVIKKYFDEEIDKLLQEALTTQPIVKPTKAVLLIDNFFRQIIKGSNKELGVDKRKRELILMKIYCRQKTRQLLKRHKLTLFN